MDLHWESLLSKKCAVKHVGDVWSRAEFPNRALDHDEWRDLFELAGYTVDGVAADRPAEPLQLYRAATYEHRLGWLWTASRAFADHFAGIREHRRSAVQRIWAATVEPWRLLARNVESRPGESEYVVQTAGLTVAEL